MPSDDRRSGPDRSTSDRPEDNPFIAFRRFADSQVSSLLNTVFTLPSTIAGSQNIHHAREACLFGRADASECNKLAALEQRIAGVQAEREELRRVGEYDALLEKCEELAILDVKADQMRRSVLDGAEQRDERGSRQSEDLARRRKMLVDDDQARNALIEKVGNQKGQEWGWMWDWGFPRPFDADETTQRNDACRRWQHKRGIGRSSLERSLDDDVEEKPKHQSTHPSLRDAESLLHVFDDVSRAIASEVPHIFGSPWYSPTALEASPELRKSKIPWRDAYEDLLREEYGAPSLPSQRPEQTERLPYDEWTHRFRDPATVRNEFERWVTGEKQVGRTDDQHVHKEESGSEEPTYEYAHDHEDQHDDPPTPKAKQGRWFKHHPATELDAYERLLVGRVGESGLGLGLGEMDGKDAESKPSVMSTLTTTERSVALDGSVTTKVVLKKRFADGREESSETVHTQRGNEDPAATEASVVKGLKTAGTSSENKEQRGWFWSK